MGYSEVCCHICGMSFNVGRLRRPDEPPGAGWDSSGYSTGQFVRSPSHELEMCPEEAGCRVVLRNVVDRRYVGATAKLQIVPNAAEDDDSEDEDFVYRSSEEDDSYEYDTPDEDDPEDDPEDSSDTTSDTEQLYDGFLRGCSTSLTPETSSDSEKMVRQRLCYISKEGLLPNQDLEHIAGGLGCRLSNNQGPFNGGYNGHVISVDEMRGCNTLQCLARKPKGWRAEPDDEEFELQGDYFLTGLSDFMPSRDEDVPKVFPERHGCGRPHAENIVWEPAEIHAFAMPFHPTCLEVFKRASFLRTGNMDIQGLLSWWALEATYKDFRKFPRDRAYKRAQWFDHIQGTEFLAANPCFVMELRDILASADRRDDASFTSEEVSDTTHAGMGTLDTFSSLPQNIRAMILQRLHPADIANLRLASRIFQHLPQSLFRSLVLREMPWLWEAWSSLDYSFWATTTSLQLRTEDDEKRSKLVEIQQAINVLSAEGRQDGLSNENDDVISAMKQIADEEEIKHPHLRVPVPLLAAETTDWYFLYCSLAKSQSRILGLRNRRRIWKDCDEILDRIGRYRAAGKIPAINVHQHISVNRSLSNQYLGL